MSKFELKYKGEIKLKQTDISREEREGKERKKHLERCNPYR